MKKIIALLFLLPLALLAQFPQNVQKLSGALTQGFNVPTGVTIAATGAGTIHATSVNSGTASSLTALSIRSTGAAFDLTFASSEVLTAGRTLSFNVGDAARSVTLGGNLSLAGSLTTSGAFASTFTMTGTTTVTFPTSGTLATTAGTVSSIAGTTNQISASASTGAVTLSLAGPFNFTSLTSTAVLLGGGTSAINASDMTYSTPTLSVPASFVLSGAGSLSFTAGGSNQNVNVTPSGTGYFQVSANATSVTPGAGTLFNFVTGNGTMNAIEVHAFATNSVINFSRANGTAASKTALSSGDSIMAWGLQGYGTTTFPATSGVLRFYATENFTDTALGTGFKIELMRNSAGPGARLVTFAISGTGNITINNSGTDNLNGQLQMASSSATTGLALGTRAAEVIYRTADDALRTDSTWTIAAPVRTSGVASYFTVTPGADTGITANTESIGANWATATRTHADGTVALQRDNFWAGQTHNKTTTSATFTDIFTGYMTPPVAGSGVSFTRGHTFGIVDSTSAASSITGGFIVATTVGTTATSVGIGGGNINAGGTITSGGTLTAATSRVTLSTTSTYGVINFARSTSSSMTMFIQGTGNVTTDALTIYSNGGSHPFGTEYTSGAMYFYIDYTTTPIKALDVVGTALATGTTTSYWTTEATTGGAAGLVSNGGIYSAKKIITASTITTLGGATFHTTSSALTDGAGVQAATILTSPVAGNPTKWIGINDNGTTRYIPAW